MTKNLIAGLLVTNRESPPVATALPAGFLMPPERDDRPSSGDMTPYLGEGAPPFIPTEWIARCRNKR